MDPVPWGSIAASNVALMTPPAHVLAAFCDDAMTERVAYVVVMKRQPRLPKPPAPQFRLVIDDEEEEEEDVPDGQNDEEEVALVGLTINPDKDDNDVPSPLFLSATAPAGRPVEVPSTSQILVAPADEQEDGPAQIPIIAAAAAAADVSPPQLARKQQLLRQ
jgi:hypothetical protein